MNHAQTYLAQANRQIAELMVQIAAQRVIVRHALDRGQGSDMAESLLDAPEGSLRIFEKHRYFCSVPRCQPSEQADHLSGPTRRLGNDGPGLATTHTGDGGASWTSARQPGAHAVTSKHTGQGWRGRSSLSVYSQIAIVSQSLADFRVRPDLDAGSQ